MDSNKEGTQTQHGDTQYDTTGFPYVDVPPDTAFMCRSWLEFYRLKPRKRKHIRDNIEINEGCFYLIKATRSGRWYVRDITQFTDPRSLKDVIRLGNIYLLYTEEVAESIRSDVESSGLPYRKFIARAEASMSEEEVDDGYYYDGGMVSRQSIYKDKINQIKKY